MKNKLDICKSTRKIAADSLLKTLQQALSTDSLVSEFQFHDIWLSELRKNSEIFPDGWYTPPPHGIGVLFADESNLDRINYKSLRPEENWPKENIYLNKETGIIYLFAGPVDRNSGVIGDFGITIYFGKNQKLINHLVTSYKITKEIFLYTKIGMNFSYIAKYSSKLCKENNVINLITSTTDPAGTNIGHTVPATEKNWTVEEIENFKSAPWEIVCKQISTRRIFVNEVEETMITKGMALTLEPRPGSLTDITIPMVSFHTISLFHESGEKELLTNFDDIFKLVGMNYML